MQNVQYLTPHAYTKNKQSDINACAFFREKGKVGGKNKTYGDEAHLHKRFVGLKMYKSMQTKDTN